MRLRSPMRAVLAHFSRLLRPGLDSVDGVQCLRRWGFVVQLSRMTLRLARGCDTPLCENEARREITDHGRHLAWHCHDCIDVIERILKATSTMVKQGTPRDIAADWAAALERRRA